MRKRNGFIVDMKRERPFALTVKLSPDQFQKLERFLADHRLSSKQRYIEFLIAHGIEQKITPPESDY